MARVKLGRGPQWAQVQAIGDGLLQSVALHLAEPPARPEAFPPVERRWRFEVQARTRSGAVSYVGAVVTAPPGPLVAGERVVAVAALPDAVGWMVRAELESGAADDRDAAWLELSANPDLGGCCGLKALHGAVLVSEGLYEQQAGTGGGVVTLPAGARLVRWSATAVGGDGTVAISGPDGVGVETTVTIRDGGAFTDEPEHLAGLRTFTLNGVDTWFFAWRR